MSTTQKSDKRGYLQFTCTQLKWIPRNVEVIILLRAGLISLLGPETYEILASTAESLTGDVVATLINKAQKDLQLNEENNTNKPNLIQNQEKVTEDVPAIQNESRESLAEATAKAQELVNGVLGNQYRVSLEYVVSRKELIDVWMQQNEDDDWFEFNDQQNDESSSSLIIGQKESSGEKLAEENASLSLDSRTGSDLFDANISDDED